MAFHVGQRVVCVDDSATHFRVKQRFMGLLRRWVPHKSVLTRGCVYTVSRVGVGYNLETGEECPAIQVAEISLDGDEALEAHRFRPLDESRLDVFRQLLVTPPGVKEMA